jgi:glycosyltransferase involved in cell wall biosynthesis
MINAARVLAWPAFKAKLSPAERLLYREMQGLGATVEEFSAWRVLSRRYDIVHLHWPEYCVNERGPLASLFWSCALFAAMRWVQIRGGKVVWTVHNLESHLQQRPTVEHYFFKIFTALLNGYITLTEGGGKQALERFPSLRRVPGFVVPHGNIRDGYSGVEISQEQARSSLRIPSLSKVLAFFGAIEGYNGVTELAEAFSKLDDSSLLLLIAGKCCLTAQDRQRLENIAAVDTRVHLHLDYIPPDEVARYLRAADLVVLPFRAILNSGSAVLSLALDRPVLVPDKGSLRELRTFAGAEWVRLYSGDLTPKLLEWELNDAIRGARVRGGCRALENGWNGLTWRNLAERMLQAYDSIVRFQTNAAGHHTLSRDSAA